MAHQSKRKGSGFELEVVKVLQGHAIEAVKIPLQLLFGDRAVTPTRKPQTGASAKWK